MSEERFCDWVANAQPGHRVDYYNGLLAHDRMPSAKVLPEPDRLGLVAVARRAMQLSDDGRVLLVQQRLGEGSYAYTAIKTLHRRPGVSERIDQRGGSPCML